MLISERIYECLREKGISQIEFAKKTGISQSTISDWRRKGTNPSADKIMVICEVLGVSPYELLQGTGNEKMKELCQPDYVMIDKNSGEYVLIEAYRGLNQDGKNRVMGYINALLDEK